MTIADRTIVSVEETTLCLPSLNPLETIKQFLVYIYGRKPLHVSNGFATGLIDLGKRAKAKIASRMAV